MSPLEHPAMQLLAEMLSVPAPSGREEMLADIVRGKLDEMSYDHQTDPAGNVTVHLPGYQSDAPPIMLAAHMDEIGMVVTGIDPDGSLRIDRSGALFPYKLGERPVTIVGDGEPITGVASIGSTHTGNAEVRQVTWSDVRIITGLTPQQLYEAGIRVGSTAVPVTEGRGPIVFGPANDPLVGAWTFDDRAGVVTLIRLLEAIRGHDITPARSLIVGFTVHEEGGCHGAKVLAMREKPEIFLAVDGCPMPTGTDLVLDSRPVVWSKDRLCHLDQLLIGSLRTAASQAGFDLQTAVLNFAMSDASAVYNAGAAPRVGIIGHNRENSHGFEVAKLRVFDNVLNTLFAFIQMEEV